MAESKSEEFSFPIKDSSEKNEKFSPNRINTLDHVSERAFTP